MSIFNMLYALPEEFYESSRMTSLKPWEPVYEDDVELNNGADRTQRADRTETTSV